MRATIHLLISIILISACQVPNQDLDETKEVKTYTSVEDNTIINLYDAFGKNRDGLIKDFGFSALIKYKGKVILFDAGTNADILKNNVEALGIDLSEVDIAVGSHAHGDHLNGFDYLLAVNPDVKLYLPLDFYVGAKINFNVAGQESLVADSLPEEMRYFSGSNNDYNLTINQSGRFKDANTQFIKESTQLEEGIKLIFTRSPYLGYASKYPSVEELKATGNQVINDNNDEIKFAGLPELSLSLSTQEGEVLVVGCSHSSVQNIIIETKSYTNKGVSILYGGYHMLPYDRNETNAVALQLMNDLKVKKIAPAHCTGHLAFKILLDTYNENYLFAGLGETIKITN